MAVTKARIEGNDYIGAYAIATDTFSLVPSNISEKDEKAIREGLGVKTIKLMIDNSDLIGLYAVANSHSILLPATVSNYEMRILKESAVGIEISTIETSLNAVRNNILVNDKIAIINPEFEKSEERKISDALNVEVIKLEIGGFKTVGANNLLTNKGMVLNNMATDEEMEKLREIVKNTSQSTANLGSPCIGLCAITNSTGLIAGMPTTGFELVRMTEGLDL